jgi:hypothetical protein
MAAKNMGGWHLENFLITASCSQQHFISHCLKNEIQVFSFSKKKNIPRTYILCPNLHIAKLTQNCLIFQARTPERLNGLVMRKRKIP